MSGERSRFIVASHLLFIRDGEVLLLRRSNTGYEDGNYSVPAGHVEANETPRAAAIREAREEVGAEITMSEGPPVTVVLPRLGDVPRIGFFFVVEQFRGDLRNREPEKCDELRWSPVDDLPDNVVPYVRHAIETWRAGETYVEFG